MSIRKPTRKEINEIEVVDLTSATIWNPREKETDTAHNLVWEYRDETNVIHCKIETKPEPERAKYVRWRGYVLPPLRIKKYTDSPTYCKVRRDITHLGHTVNVACVLEYLSTELRQYIHRETVVPDKNQNVTATLVKNLHYATVSVSLPLDNKSTIGIGTISNSHATCHLGPEWIYCKSKPGKNILLGKTRTTVDTKWTGRSC